MDTEFKICIYSSFFLISIKLVTIWLSACNNAVMYLYKEIKLTYAVSFARISNKLFKFKEKNSIKYNVFALLTVTLYLNNSWK